MTKTTFPRKAKTPKQRYTVISGAKNIVRVTGLEPIFKQFVASGNVPQTLVNQQFARFWRLASSVVILVIMASYNDQIMTKNDPKITLENILVTESYHVIISHIRGNVKRQYNGAGFCRLLRFFVHCALSFVLSVSMSATAPSARASRSRNAAA